MKNIMYEIYHGNDSELAFWLARRDIKDVFHLTQFDTHNLPLSLSSNSEWIHHFIPGLTVWHHRNAINITSVKSTNFNSSINSQVYAAAQMAVDRNNPKLFIPYVEFERVGLESILEKKDILLSKDNFPNHQMPLAFAHIACHGIPDDELHGGAKLILDDSELKVTEFEKIDQMIDVTILNACIGGMVHEDNHGEPLSLLIPLMMKSKYTLAAVSPLPDITSSYFATLLFYYYFTKEQNIENSVINAKQALSKGQWPDEAKQIVLDIYNKAVELLFDEIPDNNERFLFLRRKFKMRNISTYPTLCYCLSHFHYGKITRQITKEGIKKIIQEQFENSVTKHLHDEVEAINMDIFINSMRLFG